MNHLRVLLTVSLAALAACSTQDEAAAPEDPHAAHRAAAADSAGNAVAVTATNGLDGYAMVEIALDRQQLIGLKTGVAERATLSGTIRASATVEADETRDAHVHSRLMGWVRTLEVSAVGQTVTKGQPLYSLYSQELHAAQQEYLQARQTAPDLAKSARARLVLWDVPDDQIALIEKSGAREEIVFRSPIRGTVIEKEIREGHYVEPDMMLYRIADLSRVWIIAEIYEYEIERIDREGTATVQVQGVEQPIRAKLDYVYPTVDPQRRTVKVRLVAPNADGSLRPGSFATVELPGKAVEALWVPDVAVIDTGIRQVVYLALGNGHFQPVQVKAGRRSEGRVEIVEGLEAGARVVTSAQFLLDSESRIRGAGKNAPSHGGH